MLLRKWMSAPRMGQRRSTPAALAALLWVGTSLVGTGCVGSADSQAEADDGAVSASVEACAEWAEGASYSVGQVVRYRDVAYTALIAHTAHPGTNWNPQDTPALWSRGGACGAPALSVRLTASP